MGCICQKGLDNTFEAIIAAEASTPNVRKEKIVKIKKSKGGVINNSSHSISKTDNDKGKLNTTNATASATNGIITPPIEVEFKIKLFEQINILRTDPKSYSQIIGTIVENIYTDTKLNKFYIEKNENIVDRVILKKGASAFIDCSTYLQGIYPMNGLEYRKELEIPISDDSVNWTKRTHLTKIIETKISELNSTFSGFGFHFDNNVKDPVLSVVTQVVDDGQFFGQRRSNILSHKFKYIGITNSDFKDKEKFCIYLNFAY